MTSNRGEYYVSPQQYNWTVEKPEAKAEPAENVNRPHMVLRLWGNEIQPGDYVESELADGVVKRNWFVVAERGQLGLGWRFVGNKAPEVGNETRWTPDKEFKIRRFYPEENEFGEVKP